MTAIIGSKPQGAVVAVSQQNKQKPTYVSTYAAPFVGKVIISTRSTGGVYIYQVQQPHILFYLDCFTPLGIQ